MADYKMAKVILYIDGSVHICLDDYRSFYGTASNLMSFFSDPINFMKKGINQEYESTQDINPERRPLDKLVGVTLAYLTSNKEIICNFPELFQFIFSSASNEERNNRLNMRSFVFERKLSDAKSFLLKYYLDFVDNYGNGTVILNKLEINEGVLFSTLREIFNSAFSITSPKKPRKSLDDRLGDLKHKVLFDVVPDNEIDDYLSVAEYAELFGVTSADVKTWVKQGRITQVIYKNNNYYINKHEKPAPLINTPPKKQEKAVKANRIATEDAFLSSPDNWSAAKVEQYIIDEGLFSPVVARYIYSKSELDYYVKNNFMEVEWNGRRFLIKDFDIHYRGPDGRTNRERMLNGEAPLAVDDTDTSNPAHPVEVHHLAQRDVILVTLEKQIHNGKGYSSMFHPYGSNEILHNKYFEEEKKKLWKAYIIEYDKAGSFEKISHIYPRKTRNKGK